MHLTNSRTVPTLLLALPLFLVAGCAVHPAASPRPVAGVALPTADPLLSAIEHRLGRPDRVTGSGRMFLHYDLTNQATVTLVVSGDQVVGVQYGTSGHP